MLDEEEDVSNRKEAEVSVVGSLDVTGRTRGWELRRKLPRTAGVTLC